jgi:hypothetical protein
VSWRLRDPRLIVLAVAIVVALDIPALVTGSPLWVEVLLAIAVVAALSRAVFLWRTK